jgi:hypothetical protein
METPIFSLARVYVFISSTLNIKKEIQNSVPVNGQIQHLICFS